MSESDDHLYINKKNREPSGKKVDYVPYGANDDFVYVSIANDTELKNHCKAILNFESGSTLYDKHPARAALQFFNAQIYRMAEEHNDGWTVHHRFNAIVPSGSENGLIQDNPFKNQDFFDLQRELVSNIQNLSSYLKGINDKALLSAHVRSLRAYLDALSGFIDVNDSSMSSENVPSVLPDETKKSIKKIDWSKLSSEARSWADTIFKILSKLFF